MLEDGLTAFLNASAGVEAIVGNRVYPLQGTPDEPLYPYITYKDVSGSADYTLDGAQCSGKRIQFDLWGRNYSDGKAMSKALRNSLSGLSVTLVDGTRILFSKKVNEMDNFDVASRSYHSICEYEFTYVEQ